MDAVAVCHSLSGLGLHKFLEVGLSEVISSDVLNE
jgi:hypothetical protein